MPTAPERNPKSVRGVKLELSKVIAIINDMQSTGNIGRYAIGGAVGAAFYIEPARTVDVDIFTVLQTHPNSLILSLEPIRDYLRKRGYEFQGEYVVIEGWPVQFLSKPGLVDEAIMEAREFELEQSVRTFVFSAEHLVAIALQTNRPKDIARIAQFVEANVLDLKRLEDILRRHGLADRWARLQRFWRENS
jgi:hypothetical protein